MGGEGKNPGSPNPKGAGIPGATDGGRFFTAGEAGEDEEELTQPRTPTEHRVVAVKPVGEINVSHALGDGQRKKLADCSAVGSWKSEDGCLRLGSGS